MICDACKQKHAVMLAHELRIGRRVVRWSICVSCELKDRRG